MTPTQRLAEATLRRPLVDYIDEQRADGKSWRSVARRLERDTYGIVDVSHETLRKWWTDRQDVAA